jgi:putative flippase GtrA
VAGFPLTGMFVYLFHTRLGVSYVLAAVMSSSVLLFCSFAMDRIWAFSGSRWRA